MATMLYKGKRRESLIPCNKVNELIRMPERSLSYEMIRKAEDSPEDAKKILAIHLANRVYNMYRGLIKYGKMNFRIHTKDNGIVIVIKHEW